jgi:hypothetical protein
MEYSNDITSKATTQPAANRSNEKVVQNKGRELKDNRPASIIQKKANNTGLPDHLKAGMENLTNKNLDHVKVHYNSSKPAEVRAYAYAQGSNIHLGPGQEKHLPHELGHVVQQMEGRVKPTMKIGGTHVNNDPSLEQEATHMGDRAIQRASFEAHKTTTPVHTNETHSDYTAQFQSMDHLGMPGVNYAIMSQAGYSEWQKTTQAKFMSGIQQYGNQVVVTQFQNRDEVQQLFLPFPNSTLGVLVALEGVLATAAGVAVLAASHGAAFLVGIPMIGVGIAKMIRGYYTYKGGDKPTPKQQKIINGLRAFEAAVALVGGAVTGNIPAIIFGVAKALRSLLHFIMDGMDKDNPSLTFKIISGTAAALHWIEVAAGIAAGVGSAQAGGAVGIAGAITNIGVATSKTVRSGHQTYRAKNTISKPTAQPDINRPLLA